MFDCRFNLYSVKDKIPNGFSGKKWYRLSKTYFGVSGQCDLRSAIFQMTKAIALIKYRCHSIKLRIYNDRKNTYLSASSRSLVVKTSDYGSNGVSLYGFESS